MSKTWAVTITVEGEDVLNIGSNYLSGVDDIDRHSDIVKMCADHLLAFIGGKDWGTLLDAWEELPNDVKADPELQKFRRHIESMGREA